MNSDKMNDLDVLFPDVTVRVRDPETGDMVDIVVREFRFLEGLKAQVHARPLITAFSDAVDRDELITADSISQALSDHANIWIDLIAHACDRDPDWIASLSDADGDQIADAMWSANGSFLTRRVATEMATRRNSQESVSESEKSSPSSSGQDTDPDTTKSVKT